MLTGSPLNGTIVVPAAALFSTTSMMPSPFASAAFCRAGCLATIGEAVEVLPVLNVLRQSARVHRDRQAITLDRKRRLAHCL